VGVNLTSPAISKFGLLLQLFLAIMLILLSEIMPYPCELEFLIQLSCVVVPKLICKVSNA
jgi:hypothetical protein